MNPIETSPALAPATIPVTATLAITIPPGGFPTTSGAEITGWSMALTLSKGAPAGCVTIDQYYNVTIAANILPPGSPVTLEFTLAGPTYLLIGCYFGTTVPGSKSITPPKIYGETGFSTLTFNRASTSSSIVAPVTYQSNTEKYTYVLMVQAPASAGQIYGIIDPEIECDITT